MSAVARGRLGGTRLAHEGLELPRVIRPHTIESLGVGRLRVSRALNLDHSSQQTHFDLVVLVREMLIGGRLLQVHNRSNSGRRTRMDAIDCHDFISVVGSIIFDTGSNKYNLLSPFPVDRSLQHNGPITDLDSLRQSRPSLIVLLPV